MSAALACLDDDLYMPRPARHVYLYLAAVDGVIVSSVANRSRAGCMRTGTSALPSDKLGRRTDIDNPDTGRVETVYDLASNPTRKITPNLRESRGQIPS